MHRKSPNWRFKIYNKSRINNWDFDTQFISFIYTHDIHAQQTNKHSNTLYGLHWKAIMFWRYNTVWKLIFCSFHEEQAPEEEEEEEDDDRLLTSSSSNRSRPPSLPDITERSACTQSTLSSSVSAINGNPPPERWGTLNMKAVETSLSCSGRVSVETSKPSEPVPSCNSPNGWAS